MSLFENREDAARQLSKALSAYMGMQPLVLAIPRGGVPLGRIIADDLGADLDVVLVRKLGAPFNPEFAVGAIGIQRSDGLFKQILVRHAPDVFKADLVFGDVGAINHGVVVGSVVGVHVVKVAITAVEKVGGKALVFQELTHGGQMVVLWAAHDGLAWDGRCAE